MGSDNPRKDPGLEVLLSLDGEEFRFDNGYWTKFEVRCVTPDKHIPHGIRYSLTLHDSHNQRVLGYDNAHAVRSRRHRFSGKRVTRDHVHRHDQIQGYDFQSPGQLLEDFWADVNRILKAENNK